MEQVVKDYYLYMLKCENGSYYTGYTVNLEQRFLKHQRGEVKYTRAFKPLAVSCCWIVRSEVGMVLKLERMVKKLSHLQKEKLVRSPDLFKDLAAGRLGSIPEIEIYEISPSEPVNR